MTPLERLIQLAIAHPEKVKECMELAFDYGRCEEAKLSELPAITYSEDYQGCDA